MKFESPLPHFSNQLKPVPRAGFSFHEDSFAKTLPRFYHYRKPRIVKAQSGWYIEYSYRIPVHVQKLYDNKEWKRFRFREDMNHRHGAEKEMYAEWLREEMERSLKNGYNPFETEIEAIEEEAEEKELELNATDALLLFLETWRKRGLDTQTISHYQTVINRLISWLAKKSIPYADIKTITQDHIEQFLNDTKKKEGFGNRQYNNHFDFTRTAFNFLLKKKYIDESPCAGIDKMKAPTSKHRFYDDASLKEIIRVMRIRDPYCFLAFQTVYYLCIRSDKELQNLKVGNIMWSQNKVLAEVTKGKSERYIPLDENIKELFLEHGIDKYPGNYYVFGIDGKPSEKPFGRGFFAKRFRKVRDFAGLNEAFTLYGAKATRIIHLKQDGLSDSDIMSLTGHKDFTAYAKYLRDLGLDSDARKINKVSRKI